MMQNDGGSGDNDINGGNEPEEASNTMFWIMRDWRLLIHRIIGNDRDDNTAEALE